MVKKLITLIKGKGRKSSHTRALVFFVIFRSPRVLVLCFLQACTEMIMPTGGNTEESIFPASEWHYENRATYCKNNFGVEPRPNWIATEFGGHVGVLSFSPLHHHSSMFHACKVVVCLFCAGHP